MIDRVSDAAPSQGARTLADLRPGEAGCVELVEGDSVLRPRLLEMGLLPETEVALIRRAPLGCPIEIDVRGARYSIRSEDARQVRLRRHD